MIHIKGENLPIRLLNKHIYVCDLIYFDGAVLSLFRDQKQSWFYLWCDTDGPDKDRWLLFPVDRGDLINYLQKSEPLISLLQKSRLHWVLTITNRDLSLPQSTIRYLKNVQFSDIPQSYLPNDESFFDENLAPDISLAQELNPTIYEVSIDGSWFFSDLTQFSRWYSQLYAFFYSTRPRFVTNIGQRLKRNLEAPWRGGFSRVHLFSALSAAVPAVHDLRITSIQYASPGKVKIEALKSVGDQISEAVTRFLDNEDAVTDAERALSAFLSLNKLNRKDLSKLADDQLMIDAQNNTFLRERSDFICTKLGIKDEVAEFTASSPNIIVATKALIALVDRLRHLADLQKNGLINVGC